MRIIIVGGFALLLTTAAVGVEPAHAQPTPATRAAAAPTEDATKRADTLFEEGRAAVKQQLWQLAEAKFDAAFALNPSYDVATNLGQTQYRLGKLRDAATHLAFALRVSPLSAKSDQKEAAAKRLAEIRQLIGSVTVRVNVPEAAVFVDGAPVGRSPLAGEVFVDPGPRVIEVKLAGYEDGRQSVDAAKGTAQEVNITLVPKKSASEGSPTLPVKPQLGGPDGQKEKPVVEGGPNKTLLITGIASSAVAVGAGIIFAVVANGHAMDAEDQRAMAIQEGVRDPCLVAAYANRCKEHQSTLAAGQTFTNLSIWSIVAGGALGAGTVIYAVAAPRSKPDSGVHVAPIVASRGGGVVIGGRW